MKKTAFWVAIIAFLLWLTVPIGKEAIKRHDGKRCHENITYIENGKKRYIQSLSFQEKGQNINPPNPNRYIDLIPYMPLKNIPECPSGKPYLNVLELSIHTTCQVNGNKNYEPETPHVSPTKNGYHDPSKPADTIPLWKLPLQMLGIQPKETTSPFQQ